MLTALLAASATAASVGLGCGTCCSPAISGFLSAYVLSRGEGLGKSALSFLWFLLGKLAAVTAACAAASLLGRAFVDASGKIGSFDLYRAAKLALVLLGLGLTADWFVKRRKKPAACSSCGSCGGHEKQAKALRGESGFGALFAVGLAYGLSPCAPFLVIVGLSAALTTPAACAAGTAFALASSLTPALLLLLSGALSRRAAREIPRYLDWLRLGCYLLLTTVSAVSLF